LRTVKLSVALIHCQASPAGDKDSEVKRIPKDLWQPDFYAICTGEGSLAALDTETMSEILEWSKKQNLIQYFEKKARKRITLNPLKKFCQAQELSGAND
jgi:hypothetical protein